MHTLTAGLLRLRCRVLPEREDYRYEVNVLGRWWPCNYTLARWTVEYCRQGWGGM
ncbi:hypothetical protein WKE96_09805 [Edwardsiella tarda]|uniref:hypothetical protein n=1 Tax=Edwardsiella tarda TaxID=636 RepID=UPI0039BE67F8